MYLSEGTTISNGMAARKSAELGILTLLTAALAGGVGFVMYERKVNKNRVKITLEDGDRAGGLEGWLALPAQVKARLPDISPADILLGNSARKQELPKTQPPPQDGVGSAGNKED